MTNHKQSFIPTLASYIKIFILALLALVVVLLAIQNHQSLSQEISLKLNLYFWEGATAPYPLYMVVVLAFLLGILLASLAGIASRFYLRRQLKEAENIYEAAEKEIRALRGMSLHSSAHGNSAGTV
jgi:uncharacterized integral membrane protein